MGKGWYRGKKDNFGKKRRFGKLAVSDKKGEGAEGKGKKGGKPREEGNSGLAMDANFYQRDVFYNNFISSLSFVLVFDERKIKIEFGI